MNQNDVKQIKKPILIPLGIVVVFLWCVIISGAFWLQRIHINNNVKSNLKGTEMLFHGMLDEEAKFIGSIIDFYDDNENLQNAYLFKDKEELLKLTTSIFKEIRSKYNITHFYFINTDRTCFLRTHNPPRAGDYIDRITMAEAERTGERSFGIELGKYGTFTLRVVHPWIVGGNLIGYIELGKETEYLVPKVKKILDVELLILLNKSNIERSDWEEGLKMMGRTENWDKFHDQVVISKTMDIIPANTIEQFYTKFENHHNVLLKGSINTNLYRGGSIFLKDASNRVVGDIIVLKDFTNEENYLRLILIILIISGVCFGSLLFLFFYGYISRMENRLITVHEGLQEEIRVRKQAEHTVKKSLDESQRLTKELESKNIEINTKSKELEKAYTELKATQSQMLQREKMASIGQLAAGVAHEINNPIGFISSNLNTLKEYIDRFWEFINAQSDVLAPLINEEAKNDLNSIQKRLKIDYIHKDALELTDESLDGSDRISKIVQGLKSFSRINKIEYELSDINECLESTLNISWNELKYKAEVTKEYGELPQTYCYPQQLNQVFMNLLINSAQSIEKTGKITIKTWHQNKSIFIAISDTGHGIPENIQHRLFEPFFTTKDVGKGTGLGLSISYDIIKKHKGNITIESELKKWTTFTIQIPVITDI